MHSIIFFDVDFAIGIFIELITGALCVFFIAFGISCSIGTGSLWPLLMLIPGLALAAVLISICEKGFL